VPNGLLSEWGAAMGSEWHVGRDGETFGPFTFDELSTAVREGNLYREDLVWSPGMTDWCSAAEVPGLWRPPVLRGPTTPLASHYQADILAPEANAISLRETDQPQEENGSAEEPRRAPVRPGLIRRHWRGDLTLAQAYWGVGLLLTLVALWLAHLFGSWLEKAQLPIPALGMTLFGFLSLLCVMTVWQFVGIWRAAGKYNGRASWSALARLAVVLGAMRAVYDFGTVIWPMLSESAMLASGQENIAAHQLRLLRNGTEIELAGGMPFGTAEALKRLLDAALAPK
jgi:hypothetical protein